MLNQFEETPDNNQEKIKNSGEFYTPIEVVNCILDSIGYTSQSNIRNKLIIDTSCGDGVFLVEVTRRLLKDFETEGFDLNDPDGVKMVLEVIANNVYGIDINYDSCEKTKRKLFFALKRPYEIVKKKYRNYTLEFNIFCLNSLLPNKLDETKFDYVVGNPPYIRIQRIKPDSLRKTYKDLYQSAVGRFDISVLFIERGLKWLKPSGLLGFIVSNKFLTANYGKGIRDFIIKSFSLKRIINLTDIEPFQVSVLPCILILKNESESSKYFHYCIAKKAKGEFEERKVKDFLNFATKSINEPDLKDFTGISLNANGERTIFQCFDAEIPSSDDVWFFIPPPELKIVKKIENRKTHTLEELSEHINVGIKTTANSVFCNQLTKEFIKRHALESEIIYPCLRGSNVKRWKVEWSGTVENKDTYIIYPHKRKHNRTVPVDLKNYPHIRSFLESHKEELNRRYYLQDAGRKWYEIWVPQNLGDFAQRHKIVASDLSSHNTFALDKNRFFCIDSCYYIILKNKSEGNYKFILGLLNSKVMEFFHKRVASTYVYSNRYRYMSSYMKKYPIVSMPDELMGKRIIKMVDRIMKAVKENKSKRDILELESQLNKTVYRLYKLTEAEQAIIENALKIW